MPPAGCRHRWWGRYARWPSNGPSVRSTSCCRGVSRVGGVRVGARRQQLAELVDEVAGQGVEVRYQLTAGDEPEMQAAAIAVDGDVQALPVGHHRHRVIRQELRAGQ